MLEGACSTAGDQLVSVSHSCWEVWSMSMPGESRGNLHQTCRVGSTWSVLCMVCPRSLATRTACWDVSLTFMWLRTSSVLSTNRTAGVWPEGLCRKVLAIRHKGGLCCGMSMPEVSCLHVWEVMLAGNARCLSTVARKGLANTPNRKQGLFVQ